MQDSASGVECELLFVGAKNSGKSTLMGQMLLLAGQVDQRTMHKYEKESATIGKASFRYAWVMDQSDEEVGQSSTMKGPRAPARPTAAAPALPQAPRLRCARRRRGRLARVGELRVAPAPPAQRWRRHQRVHRCRRVQRQRQGLSENVHHAAAAAVWK